MRKIVILGFAAGLLTTTLPASAATNGTATRSDATASDRPVQANGAPDPNRQICIRDVRSESRIRRQICHTAREWRDLQGSDQD
ncbi:MAG: hypothetical protein JO276_14650 [Sphingomonadaceae bacterium]|nr:hypothetical protein [Sphingomonadaceae bacterium]